MVIWNFLLLLMFTRIDMKSLFGDAFNKHF